MSYKQVQGLTAQIRCCHPQRRGCGDDHLWPAQGAHPRRHTARVSLDSSVAPGARQGQALPRILLDSSKNTTSGLTHEAHRKEVEQVYLRCSAGSVEWMYPTGALIVNVRPNTFPPSRHLTLCIKPLKDSSGANIYLEKTGELKLLVRDGDRGPGQVRCFGFEQGGLFVEAAPQQDISRRTTGFQYELTSRHAESDLHTLSAPCRPCSDAEVLLAVCTSDFVVRGSIQNVTHVPEQQESAIHLRVSRLYRQKSRVFRPAPEGGGWRGRVATLLECGVRPGRGEFLFTGHMHFGEARLGCAPRFKDFQRMYQDAEERGLNPCEMGKD
eukprot:XP_013967502.2 meteorin-like protein [Canis lupus familiaris]